MSSLADQLLKAGVIKVETYQQHQAEELIEELNRDKKVTKGSAFVDCNDLDSCKSMAEFKQGAKEILEKDPSQIRVIVSKAHRFRNSSDPVAKKFIWFFYELWNQMNKRPKEHPTILKKAFRRHGSTFETD